MNGDLEKLQGTWNISALEVEGNSTPEAMLENAQVTVKGKRFTSTGMGAKYEGSLKLDSSANPRQIDMQFDAGPEHGNVNLGIYQLDGDTWKLCLAMRGTVRPKRFASTSGSGLALETLTRGKRKPAAKAKASAALKASGKPSEFDGDWQMVSGVMDGVAMKESDVQWVRRMSAGNEMTVTAGPQTMLKVTFSHDSSQDPKTIDYVNTAGANKGKTQLGIYEFAGDLLRVCVAAPGSSRPKEFRSVRGDQRTLTEWRRSRPS
jgi:uncharacterized protein (TIGR03067 family)